MRNTRTLRTLTAIALAIGIAGATSACSIEDLASKAGIEIVNTRTTCSFVSNSTVNGEARPDLDGSFCTTTTTRK